MFTGVFLLALQATSGTAAEQATDVDGHVLVVQVVDRFFTPVRRATVGVRPKSASADRNQYERSTDEQGFARFLLPAVDSDEYRRRYRVVVAGFQTGQRHRDTKSTDIDIFRGHSPQYYQVRVKIVYRGWRAGHP
jgi:hypothetical protein